MFTLSPLLVIMSLINLPVSSMLLNSKIEVREDIQTAFIH